MDFLPTGKAGKDLILATARELGYRVKGGTINFESEEAMDRLCSFLLYEPQKNGKSIAQLYLESLPAISPVEKAILHAAAASTTALYEIVEVDARKKRLLLHNLLETCEDFWVWDIGLSATAKRGYLIFGRIFRVDEIAYFCGSEIAFPPEEKIILLNKCARLERIRNEYIRSRKRFILFLQLEKKTSLKTKYA